MAKKEPVTDVEETVETAETETQATASAGVTVEFSDGIVRNFGKKGQILRDVEMTPEGFNVTLHLVTGVTQQFSFSKENPLFNLMASRGVLEFIGNSVAGVYQDSEGTHPEDFNLGIEQAIAALQSGVIPTRKAADSAKGLHDLIRAYHELRSEAVDENGASRFSAEECSMEACKALILGSDDATNKQRMAQASVKAKIEGYKAERQLAKAKLANAKAEAAAADLI